MSTPAAASAWLSGRRPGQGVHGAGVPRRGDTTARSRRHPENPEVAVDVFDYRPIYVHGEVKNGGEFQYKSGLRLRDAVAMAGGYTYRAEQSYVLLGRDDQKELQVTMPGDAPVLPGDNIRIPERFF